MPIEQQLALALDSHQAALKLSPQNADLLFNTAQVEASLAEESEDDQQSLGLLQDSVTLLQQCLELQGQALQQQQAYADEMAAQAAGDTQPGAAESSSSSRPGTPSSVSSDGGDWAMIEEPVTAATLLETGVALFDSLASLCERYAGTLLS